MAEIMGKHSILMLANHGVIVCGKSVAEAFNSLYFLERPARPKSWPCRRASQCVGCHPVARKPATRSIICSCPKGKTPTIIISRR